MTEQSGRTRLRVGDPDRIVTGRHSYVLSYVLHGHLNALDDHDELFWQATGTEWTVPIGNVTVDVVTPGGIQASRCLAGPPDSESPCGAAEVRDETQAVFAQDTLAPGEGLTVVVGLAKGAVTVAPPDLHDRFMRLPVSWAVGAAAVLVLGTAAACALAWNRLGRDRKFAAVPLGLTPAPGQAAAEQPVALSGEPAPAVAFVPPRGVRPALAGVLVAERVRPQHVSATIVDLAVRGHLRIEELPAGGAGGGGRDWQLRRSTAAPPDELAPFEQSLMAKLFAGRDLVLLSQLRGSFAPQFRQVSGQLADAGLRAGWFRRRPRTSSQATGCVIAGVLAVVTVPMAAFAVLGGALFLGWPVLVVAGAVVVSAAIVGITVYAIPARTALGRAMWAQVLGFRRYLETAEADQLRDDDAAARFTRYLPYALVFGLADRWSRVLGQLNQAGRQVSVDWYAGPALNNIVWLGPAMSDFSSSTSSNMSYSPSSSSAGGSSGFSSSSSVGGGSGGGGGGSW